MFAIRQGCGIQLIAHGSQLFLGNGKIQIQARSHFPVFGVPYTIYTVECWILHIHPEGIAGIPVILHRPFGQELLSIDQHQLHIGYREVLTVYTRQVHVFESGSLTPCPYSQLNQIIAVRIRLEILIVD
ncbi:hypothetical protein D3C80_1130440 [compost metagenome]